MGSHLWLAIIPPSRPKSESDRRLLFLSTLPPPFLRPVVRLLHVRPGPASACPTSTPWPLCAESTPPHTASAPPALRAGSMPTHAVSVPPGAVWIPPAPVMGRCYTRHQRLGICTCSCVSAPWKGSFLEVFRYSSPPVDLW